MMKSATGYIIICMIMLTALIGLILLLIIVTEQPDLIFGDETFSKLYSRIPPDNWSNTSVLTSQLKVAFLAEEATLAILLTSPTPPVKLHKTRLEISSNTNSSLVNAVPIIPVQHHSKSSAQSKRVTSSFNNINSSTTVYLHKIFEIVSQKSMFSNLTSRESKFVGILSTNRQIFYLPKLDGEIEVWKIFNETNFGLVNTTETHVRMHRLKFFNVGNASFLALQDNSGRNRSSCVMSNLYALDLHGGRIREKSISVAAKDVAVFADKVEFFAIYLLDRFNDTVHVYNGELEFERSMEFENKDRQSCSFIHATKNHILVSCQSAILQLLATGNGTLVQQYSIPEGSYSLPVQLLSPTSLMAVQRGREEIHVFGYGNKTSHLKAKLIHNDNTGKQPISIWSALELLRNSTVFLTLEHISNTVKLFALPESKQIVF